MALPAFLGGKNIRFRVTPKKRGKQISFQGVIGPVIIFGFNLTAIIIFILRLFTEYSFDMMGWIVFGWCLYIGGIAFTACLYCFKPLIKKSNELHL